MFEVIKVLCFTITVLVCIIAFKELIVDLKMED